MRYFSVQFSTTDAPGLLERVGQSWNANFPESSFDYFFLDEFYDRQYRDDRQFARVATLFCGLAIFIGLIGLFGLTAFAAARRTREIGVRKVLGANVTEIIALLTADLLRLLVLASVLALPLSLWLIRQWMQGFAFRASMSWLLLLAPLPVLLIVTFATTFLLTIRAARVNPVAALRSE